MGLQAFEIAKIAKYATRGGHALALGHPDILATPEELEPILGTTLPVLGQDERLDRQSYAEGIVGNAKPVFKALGYELSCVDYHNSYGVDAKIDLNDGLLPRTAYDLVIDPGTTEHVFNVGHVLMEAANAVKEGGIIYHMVPLASWNHGFWNFSPCLFHDFYTQNGFTILEILAEQKRFFKPVPVAKGGAKFEIANGGRKLNLMCIARRDRVQPIVYATQYKFVK